MDTVMAWLSAASSNLEAARMLVPHHPRSSISRAYYAAFSAGHALLLLLGGSPRMVEGTWTHTDLPEAIHATVRRGSVGVKAVDAAGLRRSRIQLRELRESADYMPLRTIDGVVAAAGCRLAGHLVETVRRRST